MVGALHHVLEQALLDMAYGRRFHGLLRQAGLADVHVEGHIVVCAGGSPGATLVRANLEQLRGDLADVSGEEVDRCCELLEDPDFSFSYQPMMCGRGRQAEPGAKRTTGGGADVAADTHPATRVMSVDEALATTRAVRKRLDLARPVDPAIIAECLALAQQAPSPSNAERFHFVIVTDPGRRAGLPG